MFINNGVVCVIMEKISYSIYNMSILEFNYIYIYIYIYIYNYIYIYRLYRGFPIRRVLLKVNYYG